MKLTAGHLMRLPARSHSHRSHLHPMPGIDVLRKGKVMSSPRPARKGSQVGSRESMLVSALAGILLLALCIAAASRPAGGQEPMRIIRPASIGVNAWLEPAVSDLGQTHAYTLTVTQDDGAGDSLCVVRLEVASGYTHISPAASPFGWSVHQSGRTVTWEADSSRCLPPGTSLDFPFSARAPAAVGGGGNYVHNWQAEGLQGGRWEGDLPARVREPDLSSAAMTVTDVNGDLLQRGDLVAYTLSVTNQGDMPARGVTFRAQGLPHHTTQYVRGSTTLNAMPIPDAGGQSPLRGGMLVQAPGEDPGVIPPGATAIATVQVQVKENAQSNQALSLRFLMSSDSGQGADQLLTGPAVQIPDAAIGLTGPNEAVACEELAYTITITNDGAGTLFDSSCEVLLPKSFAYLTGTTRVSASASGAVLTHDPIVSGGSVWFNHDGTLPNPGDDPAWDLPAGETITIEFQLHMPACEHGGRMVTARLAGRDGAAQVHAAVLPSAHQHTLMLKPVLSIRQTPVSPAAHVGDSVVWDIELSATGHGSVAQITVTELLEAGLQFDPAGTSPAPSSVASNPDGSTLLTWNEAVGDLSWLDVGASQTITVAALLMACRDYDATARARWGCAAEGPCQEISARASIDLQLAQPELSIEVTPNPITVPHCNPSGVPVTITLNNPGGPARDLELHLTRPGHPLQLSRVSGATLHQDGGDRFVVGDFTGTATITFDILHADACSTPSGAFLLQPRYRDDCGVQFTAPPVTGQIHTQGLDGLSLDLRGPIEVPEHQTQSYSLILNHGGGIPPNPVSVDITYPEPFTYVGDAAPAAAAGMAAGSPASTWNLLPGAFDGSGTVTITFSLKANAGGCGTTGAISAEASVELPCGDTHCTRTASASLPVANDCPTDTSPLCDITFERLVNGAHTATVAPCAVIDYENRIVIASAPYTLSWDELTFSADAAAGQVFLGYLDAEGNLIPGRMELLVEHGGHECLFTVIPERDGDHRLSLNLNSLEIMATMEKCRSLHAAATPVGTTVTLNYAMTAPTTSGMFFDFGRLEINDRSAFNCNGLIAEPVEIVVSRASMHLSAALPDMVDACGAGAIASIMVSKSGAFPSYDNVIYFGTDDFEYITDEADPDFFLPEFTALPNVGVPVRVSDIGNGSAGVMWKLGDLPAGFSQGRIDFPVRKRCSDATTSVRIAYDALCGNDDTDNIDSNSYQALSEGLTPLLVRRGDVTLHLTPESVLPQGNQVRWTLHAVNGGSGDAYNLRFDCTQLGSGISFQDARAYDAAGDPVTDGRFSFRVEPGGGASARGTLSRLPAGQSWTVEIDGRVTGCAALTHRIEGHWGCLGEVCQDGAQMRTASEISFPEADVATLLISPSSISACGATALEARLKNASKTRIYNPELRFTLPEGLEYEHNSTSLVLRHHGGITEPVIVNGSGRQANPARAGHDLIWDLKKHLSEAYLAPEDTLRVSFSVTPTPGFGSGILSLGGTFETPCGLAGYVDPDRPRLTLSAPSPEQIAFSAVLDPVTVCAPGGPRPTFAFEWANTGLPLYGPAEVTVLLPAGLRAFAASAAPLTLAYPTRTGTVEAHSDPRQEGSGEVSDPCRLTWRIPQDLHWATEESLTLQFAVQNPRELNCEHFQDDDGVHATIAVRTCPDGQGAMTIGPRTAMVDRLSGRPELDLRVDDLTPNGSLSAGDEIEVLFQLTNAGDARLQQGRLDLSFPAEYLSYVSADVAPHSTGSGFVRWQGNETRLGAGESAAIRTRLRVANQAALGEPFTIEAHYHDSCCNRSARQTAALILGGGAGLELQLAATAARLVPGGEITYTLHVNNSNAQALRDIVVDVTPGMPGMTFLGSDFDPGRVSFTGTAATPIWTLAPAAAGRLLAGGESELIRFSYAVAVDQTQLGTPPGSGTATLTARVVSAQDAAGQPLSGAGLFDDDSETLEIGSLLAAMDLQVVPTTATVQPGGQFTYLITVGNSGETDLTAVELEAPVPAGFSYLSWNGDEEIALLASAPQIVFSLPTLAAGAVKIMTVNFSVSPDPTQLHNPTHLVMTAAGNDPAGIAVVAMDATTSAPVQFTGTGLDVYKLADTAVALPGGEITYTITATNSGDQTLYNVQIRDDLPAGLSLADAQLAPGVSYVSSPPPTYRIAELAAGDARSFNLICTVADDPDDLPGELHNLVTAAGIDQAGNPVLAAPFTLTLPVAAGENATLSVQKTASSPILVPGAPVAYTLSVTNTSALPIYTVELTDTPPPQLTLLHAVHDSQVNQIASHPPTFAIAELPPYTSKLISLSFDTDADYSTYPDSVINLAAAEGLDSFGNPVAAPEVSASLPVFGAEASFILSKVNTKPRLYAGTETTYFITVTNTGNQDLYDVHITDLPAHNLTYVSAQFGRRMRQLSTDPIEFLIPHLPVHAAETFAITFIVDIDPNAGWVWINNSVDGYATDEGGQRVDTDQFFNLLPVLYPELSLKVTKVATQGEVIPGGTVTYLIDVENTGEHQLSQVTITDILPPGLTYAFAHTGPGMIETSANPPTFLVSTLPVGGSGRLSLTCDAAYTLDAFDPPVMNVAQAIALGPSEEEIAAEPDTVYLPLKEIEYVPYALDIQKVATTDRIVPGGTVNYLLTITNVGREELTDIEISDDPPAGLTLSEAQFDADVVQTGDAPPTFALAALQPHESTMISLIFDISDDPAQLADPSVNYASAQSIMGEEFLAADSDSSVLPVIPEPGAIDIEKVAAVSPFPAGGLGYYLITVTNTGSVPLSHVQVTDILVPEFSYVDAEPAPTLYPANTVGWALDEWRQCLQCRLRPGAHTRQRHGDRRGCGDHTLSRRGQFGSRRKARQ